MKTIQLGITEPKELYLSKKPYPQCKENDIRKVPIREINAVMSEHRGISFTWTSGIVVEDFSVLNESDEKIISKLQPLFIDPEDLIISYLNDKVGFGIFAKNKITKGSILLYSGEFKALKKGRKYPYGMHSINSDGIAFITDAKNIGNHASLFQDLYPNNVNLTHEFPYQVARNNFSATSFEFSIGRLTFYQADYDIEAKSQCGLGYGNEYWTSAYFYEGKEQKFFTLNGKMIQDENYTSFLTLKKLTNTELNILESARKNPIANKDIHKLQFSSILLQKFPALEQQKVVKDSLDMLHKIGINIISSQFMKGIITVPSDKANKLLDKYKVDNTIPSPGIAFRRAAAVGSIKDVNKLFSYFKIDTNERSSNGRSALDWANHNKHHQTAEFIRMVTNTTHTRSP